MSSAYALRVALAAEARLGAACGELAEVAAARDALAGDVATLQGGLAQAEAAVAAGAAAAAVTGRSLAGKLAAAQARAEEVASHQQVASMALTNEVSFGLRICDVNPKFVNKSCVDSMS